MAHRRISSGGPYEARIGYCRAVVTGDGWVHVAGSTGADPQTGEVPDDVVAQCRNTLAKIAAALDEAGATWADVVRVHYILPRAADFEPCWPLLAEIFGPNPPAATMIEAGLLDPVFRIEIEVTAKIG
ncbi:RidA family protein [Pseudooceanicola sp. 216_PA32_1]|uniref:RidA family protein n=1 Tax=Pseudooceanicola pacificus TaxID=2676438 RepID=A0A844WAD2_9RHOB|nr:RidA family protein [Pseudooceanicola pacificus]MWB77913.1 RidA family protein [Pseudooceanicola pacificus]